VETASQSAGWYTFVRDLVGGAAQVGCTQPPLSVDPLISAACRDGPELRPQLVDGLLSPGRPKEIADRTQGRLRKPGARFAANTEAVPQRAAPPLMGRSSLLCLHKCYDQAGGEGVWPKQMSASGARRREDCKIRTPDNDPATGSKPARADSCVQAGLRRAQVAGISRASNATASWGVAPFSVNPART
jgi:hypothetical protein